VLADVPLHRGGRYRLFFAASFSSSTLSSMSAMSRVRQQVAFDLLVVRLGHLVV
jgi:hypothetical protein